MVVGYRDSSGYSYHSLVCGSQITEPGKGDLMLFRVSLGLLQCDCGPLANPPSLCHQSPPSQQFERTVGMESISYGPKNVLRGMRYQHVAPSLFI